MAPHKNLLLPTLLLLSSATAFGAEGGSHEKAAPLTHYLHLPITNSILTSWFVTLVLVVLIRWMVGKPQIVPTRGQGVAETLFSGLRETFEPIVGKKAMPLAFPVLVCFFVFILMHNWSGLFPLVGTMGWGEGTSFWDTHVAEPILRPHTADANGTVALALASFGAWLIIIFKYAGPRVILHDLFGNKADKNELHPGMYAFLSIIFLMVGVIEIVSIFIRPLTLSARLFGNVYGGETLLHQTSFFFAFYFLELIVGLVQAFVFTLLTAVYIGLICNHGDDHGADHAHGAGDANHEASH